MGVSWVCLCYNLVAIVVEEVMYPSSSVYDTTPYQNLYLLTGSGLGLYIHVGTWESDRVKLVLSTGDCNLPEVRSMMCA